MKGGLVDALLNMVAALFAPAGVNVPPIPSVLC